MGDTEQGPGRIVVVRHGETAWSRDGRHTGRTDVALTGVGEEQARALASRLVRGDFAAVFSSPRARALETCRLAGCGEGVEVVDALEEWDYGDYEGLTTDEIRAELPGWDLFEDGCPGGEDAHAVGRRVDGFLARLGADPALVSGSIAVFAHGHVLRVLAMRWMGFPPTFGGTLFLSTATIGVLGWDRSQRTLIRWNC